MFCRFDGERRDHRLLWAAAHHQAAALPPGQDALTPLLALLTPPSAFITAHRTSRSTKPSGLLSPASVKLTKVRLCMDAAGLTGEITGVMVCPQNDFPTCTS